MRLSIISGDVVAIAVLWLLQPFSTGIMILLTAALLAGSYGVSWLFLKVLAPWKQ